MASIMLIYQGLVNCKDYLEQDELNSFTAILKFKIIQKH